MKAQQNENNPPHWMSRLLNWFCDENLLEAIEGDLYEAYQHKKAQWSRARANRWYFFNVLKFLKPHFMQKLETSNGMLPKIINYFKVALRNYKRHKLVAGINLLGLSLGLAVLIISGQYLWHQLSADRYMEDSDRIYRIVKNYRSQTYSNLSFPAYFSTSRMGQLAYAKAFEEIPEVEEVAQFTISNSDIMGRGFFVEANDRKLRGGPILYTNTPEQLQNIFQWEFLQGQMGGDLSEGVILSDKMASRFFPNEADALTGKRFFIDEKPFLIKGVVKHIPENAHFDFNLIAVVDSIPYTWGAYTYTKLDKTVSDIGAVEDKITKASYTVTPDDESDPLEKGLSLQPLRDIHLGSTHLYELEANLNPIYLYLFAAIGLVVLIITITNYVNLAVAINSNRFKEVGVRKVIGARRRDVFFQFIFESLLSATIGLPLAIGMVYLFLPYFNQVLEVGLAWADFIEPLNLLLYGAVALGIGLISGWYPSLILSGKSLQNLLNTQGGTRTPFSLRRLLLGFQFFLLIVMVGFGFYVHQQLNYVTNTDLGFEKEGILTLDIRGAEKFQKLRSTLLTNPAILAVGSGGAPGNTRFNTVTYRFEGIQEIFDDANQVSMDYASAQMFGLESEAFQLLDEGKKMVFVLNQEAGRKYESLTGNSQSNLIGSTIIQEPEYVAEDGTVGIPTAIDGFVQDFHFFSKKESFNPLFIEVYKEIPWIYGVNVKMQTSNLFETMSFIEEAYYEVEKERPFLSQFMDQKLENLYSEEYKVALIVKSLSLLSVLLALAGLIGLTYYTAMLRQKEVAIRKVLGAKVFNILGLMSKDFFLIGVWAMVVAIPVAIYVIDLWLSNFAFRINTNPLTLVMLGLGALLLMLLGVIFQSLKTTAGNPVETLRTE